MFLLQLTVMVFLSSQVSSQPPPWFDSPTATEEDPKFTELDLPASERNPHLVYIPAARAPWAMHIPRTLSDRRLVAQSLYPNMQQNYTISVPLGGNLAVTVHPRRGFITWNITYLDTTVMTHPFFTSFIHPRLPLDDGKRPVQAMPARRRKKRCCVSGAVTYNYDFDVPELDADRGTSLGPGSITYFKEDVSGGTYTLWVHNRGKGSAEFVVYSTRKPEFSPYPRIHHNDPQIKVRSVFANNLTIWWEKAPESPNVTYCIVYHEAVHHQRDDVHSSSFAAWMERDSAVHLPCTKDERKDLRNLKPNTEYHIDLLAHNEFTLRETTFMGVVVRTKKSSYGGRRGGRRGYAPAYDPENPPPDFKKPPLDHIHRWVPVLRNISAIYYPPQWQHYFRHYPEDQGRNNADSIELQQMRLHIIASIVLVAVLTA